MLKRQRQRKDEEQGLRKTRCPQFRTMGAQRKSKCARVISLPRFPFLSFTFHLRPHVFPGKSAISLERNFPDIRSTGFRFRFLFCARYASASSPICLSAPKRMSEIKTRTKVEVILRKNFYFIIYIAIFVGPSSIFKMHKSQYIFEFNSNTELLNSLSLSRHP